MPFMFNFCLRIIKCILQKTLHDLHVFFLFLSLKRVFSFSLSWTELLSKHDVPRGWSDQASDPKWNASATFCSSSVLRCLIQSTPGDCMSMCLLIADYSTTSKLLTSPQNLWNKNLHQVAPWSWQNVLLHDLGSIPVCIVCAHRKNPIKICQTIYLQRGTTPSRSRPRYCAVALPRQTNMISVSILLQSHCHLWTFWPLETTKLRI